MDRNITQVEEDSEKYIPVEVMFSLFVIVGVLGNSLILYIYGFRFQQSTTRVFILSLALFDLITCALLPYKIVLLRYRYLFDDPNFSRFETVRVYFLQVSVMILPLVSVDRYRRICKPFKKQISARIAKLMVCVTCVILATVIVFRLTVSNEHSGSYSAQTFVSSKYVTQKFSGTSLGNFYFVYTIMPFCVPLPVMVVMYFFIGLKVRTLAQESTFINNRCNTGENTTEGTILDPGDSEGAVIDTEDENYNDDMAERDDASSAFTLESEAGTSNTREHVGVKIHYFAKITSFRSRLGKDPVTIEEKVIFDNSQTVQEPLCNGEEGDAMVIPSPSEPADVRPGSEAIVTALAPTTASEAAIAGTPWKRVRKSLGDLLSSRNEDDVRRTDVELDLHTNRKHERAIPWRRMTLIFFLITVVYFLSFLPFFIIFAIFRVNPSLGDHIFSHAIFIVFYNLPYVTNISNCFLYGFFDPRFRRELKSFKSSVSSSLHISSKASG